MDNIEMKKIHIINNHVNDVVFLYLNETLILDVMKRFNFSQDVAVEALQSNFYRYGRSTKDASASLANNNTFIG